MTSRTITSGDRISHEGYNFTISEHMSDGKILFKCENSNCTSTIIVKKKEKSDNGSKYKLVSKTFEHLNSICKNYIPPQKATNNDLNTSIHEDCGEKE